MSTPGGGTVAEQRRIGFRELFGHRSFAVLYTAETASIVGDQLARVALAVLVFDRTGNAAATALTYATTFLPSIIGGFLLAGLGDRMSRRLVLVGCDLIRAVLFGLMAVGGIPIWALLSILAVAVLFEPVFSASEVSYLADALDVESYRVATGVRMVTNQVAQIAGFALGGVVVVVLAPRGALMVDAATFVLSATVIGLLLPTRLADNRGAEASPATGAPSPSFWHFGDLPYLVVLSSLAGFFVAAEGLAVPFGRYIGASTTETGLLFAAIPLGGAIGAIVLIRFVPLRRRMPTALLMSITCGLPLMVSATAPSWPIAFIFWALSGAGAAYQVEINSTAVQRIPTELRAKWTGIIGAVLLGAQGAGLIIFGLVAEWLDPGWSIAIAGLTGSVLALFVVRLRATNRYARRHGPTGISDDKAGLAAI